MDKEPGLTGQIDRRAADIETMFHCGLNACGDLAAFSDRITGFLNEVGFDSFSYAMVGAGGRRLQPPRRILATLPEALLAAYDANDYHRFDVALDYAFHNRQEALYSDLQGALKQTPFETGAKLINQEIYNLYRSFGYYDFYLIPMQRQDRISLFSVARTTPTQAGLPAVPLTG